MIIKYNVELDKNRHPMMLEESTHFYNSQALSSAPDIVDMLNVCFHLRWQAEEKVYMIAFDHRMQILGVFQVAHGQVCCCQISTREIFLRALLAGAESIILAHNHPTQIVTPSEEDHAFCKRVAEAGKFMNISLLDFLILGNGYCSFQEMQYL